MSNGILAYLEFDRVTVYTRERVFSTANTTLNKALNEVALYYDANDIVGIDLYNCKKVPSHELKDSTLLSMAHTYLVKYDAALQQLQLNQSLKAGVSITLDLNNKITLSINQPASTNVQPMGNQHLITYQMVSNGAPLFAYTLPSDLPDDKRKEATDLFEVFIQDLTKLII